MADVAALMRDLKNKLEVVITETIGTFEKASGFIVDDIEIHRTMAGTAQEPNRTEIGGVTLSVRL